MSHEQHAVTMFYSFVYDITNHENNRKSGRHWCVDLYHLLYVKDCYDFKTILCLLEMGQHYREKVKIN